MGRKMDMLGNMLCIVLQSNCTSTSSRIPYFVRVKICAALSKQSGREELAISETQLAALLSGLTVRRNVAYKER